MDSIHEKKTLIEIVINEIIVQFLFCAFFNRINTAFRSLHLTCIMLQKATITEYNSNINKLNNYV